MIAELTGKQHPHVKRDIEHMLAELAGDASSFAHIYLDSMNRAQAEYRLERREVEVLLTGYSIPLRAKVIDRLHELEQAQQAPRVRRNLYEALRLTADLEEQKEAPRLQNEAMKPAAEPWASAPITPSTSPKQNC